MNNKAFSRFLFLVCGLFFNSLAFAQNEPVAMADTMRGNGKIYVVVSVCLTIVLGLFIYVFTVDRKVSRLEQDGDR